MSLQPLYSAPVHDDIERIWNEHRRGSMCQRFCEIRKFLDEQNIYCVWIRWPHWYSASSDPILYIPAEITGVDVINKKNSREQVLAIAIKHEFVISRQKDPYALKVELRDCHFIKEHHWTSDVMRPHHECTKKALQRYKSMKDSSNKAWDVVNRIARLMYNEEMAKKRAMATPPPSCAPSASTSTFTPLASIPTPCQSTLDCAQAATPNTARSGSSSPSAGLKRPFDYVDGANEEELRSPTKRLLVHSARQSSPAVKQEEEQATPEPPAQSTEPTSPEQGEKLAKARTGITKVKSYIAAAVSQAKALDEQARVEVGESSVLRLQTQGLLMQLQRIEADSADLATEIE